MKSLFICRLLPPFRGGFDPRHQNPRRKHQWRASWAGFECLCVSKAPWEVLTLPRASRIEFQGTAVSHPASSPKENKRGSLPKRCGPQTQKGSVGLVRNCCWQALKSPSENHIKFEGTVLCEERKELPHVQGLQKHPHCFSTLSLASS